jgi:hypothetical protein
MPIKWSYIPPLKLLITCWLGEISNDDWERHYSEITASPFYAMATRSLADLTRAEVNITPEAMRSGVSSYRNRKTPLRGAIISHSSFFRAMEFQTLAQNQLLNIIVFSDFHTACTWLNVDTELAKQHLQDLKDQMEPEKV